MARHTCGGPTFGRLAPKGQCPRCDELRGGAEPIKWAGTARRERDRRAMEDIRRHDCKAAGCGPVCTYGDW
jgi:hypothetical protein